MTQLVALHRAGVIVGRTLRTESCKRPVKRSPLRCHDHAVMFRVAA